MAKRNVFKNQEGFTLIEIIAVLVILGVLAAVAVPKYFELTTNAEKKSVAMALGDAVATLNQGYASFLMNGMTVPGEGGADDDVTPPGVPTLDQLKQKCGFESDKLVLGDFTFTVAKGTGDHDLVITCTATTANFTLPTADDDVKKTIQMVLKS